MRSFWKVAAFRLTDSIRIQSGRRALRCFQNVLHHFIILNLKWYYTRSEETGEIFGLGSVLSLIVCLIATVLKYLLGAISHCPNRTRNF